MDGIKSLREKDMAQERVLMQFLEHYLYRRIFDTYDVVTDLKRQLQGVDVAVQLSTTRYHDVKAQSSPAYINNPRPTFAMEILYTNNGSDRDGWFIKSGLLTDVYVFVWIPEAITDNDGYVESVEGFKKIEVSFVDKFHLQDAVFQVMSKNALIDCAVQMRANHKRRTLINEDMWMIYTDALAERPVNLVIRRSLLDKLAYKRYIVTPQQVCSRFNTKETPLL